MENLSFNAKMGGLLKAQLGEEFGGPDTFNKLVRLIELRGGKVDSPTYRRLADMFYKSIVVSGGKVNPDELLGFGQQALPAMRAYSEDYLARVVPSLVQEFGGERAGTVSSALAMQFMGRTGIGGKRLVANWRKYGLLKPGTGIMDSQSKSGWNPQDVVGLDLGLSNPLEYFEKIMIPKLKAHGVKLDDPKQVLIAAQSLFGRQTGQRIASTFLDPKQRARIHADMALYDKASGVDKAYSQALYNDPKMAGMAAAASLKNLETMLGKSVWQDPAVTRAIISIATAVNKLAGAFDRHPGLAKGILALMGFGAVAATLKVFGIGLRFVLAPLGLFIRALSPLVSLAPMILNGLARLAPLLIRGLIAAFAFLTPVGWAIVLGAAAIALMVYFRGPLMRIWRGGWNGLITWVRSINWGGIGMWIADKLTFGLATKFKNALNNLKPSVSALGGNVGMNSTRGGLAGARAAGGPVRRGGLYLVGEHGPELFRAQASGQIFSHAKTAAMLAGAASAMVPQAAAASGSGLSIDKVEIHINGVHDPDAVAVAVRRELEKLARSQAYNLND
jgi:hypothetical protein